MPIPQQSLLVNLGKRSYPIDIGEGLLDSCNIESLTNNKRVLIVTNETIAPLYLAQLRKRLNHLSVHDFILPDGEAYKNLDEVSRIYDYLLKYQFNRDSVLIALGGGVVGDITGYVAASYLRGVDFIQVPTTLLSQVDSSVGGKTGVNHPRGKNMIGAFHQPKAVFVDTATLRTLSPRELRSGLAEVIKYGLIFDKAFFRWLEENLDAILRLDEDAITYVIKTSCELKARIVELDEYESGARAFLNLGHTFGHAIESGMGYGNWLHGEAIAAGSCMAAYMSELLGHISAEELVRIETLFQRAALPIAPPAELTPRKIQADMQLDKKVKYGKVRLVLLEKLGKAYVTADYSDEQLQTVFTHYYPNTRL